MNKEIDPKYYRENFLNGIVPETAIYKYIPVNYIAEMKRNRTLRFARVNSWEDVYENYFLKQRFVLPDDTPVSADRISDDVYGQCWSLLQESDAMWRIYSQDKRTIKVRTTVEKLMDVLYVDDSCMANTYIGKIDYLSQQEIEDYYRKLSESRAPVAPVTINDLIVCSLMKKRMEFAHEEEVRILRVLSSEEAGGAYIDMPFNPDSFFEEFIIDPRASETEERDIRRFLTNCGIEETKVEKSHLYDLHTYTLVL